MCIGSKPHLLANSQKNWLDFCSHVFSIDLGFQPYIIAHSHSARLANGFELKPHMWPCDAGNDLNAAATTWKCGC